jgi:DNA mismatch endonuclease (patch repair protein)
MSRSRKNGHQRRKSSQESGIAGFGGNKPAAWQAPPGSWASSPGNRRSMLGNRGKDTSPELAVRRLLHRSGLRYRVDVRPIQQLRRKADVVFPRQKIAVFIDGCFWHACPEHFVWPKSNVEYWQKKIGGNKTRDIETSAKLESQGWTVLRYWSHDPPETIAHDVQRAVGRARSQSASAEPTDSERASRAEA